MTYHHVPLIITDQIVAAMSANLDALKAALGNFEITEDALKLLPKMGPRRFAFHAESYRMAQQFPHILFHNRSFLSYDQVKRNYELLAPVYSELNILFKHFTVIMQVLGSNTVVHAFSTYEAIRSSNNDGIQGIDYARKTLGGFFKGQGVQEEPEAEDDQPFIPGQNGGPNPGAPTDGGDGK